MALQPDKLEINEAWPGFAFDTASKASSLSARQQSQHKTAIPAVGELKGLENLKNKDLELAQTLKIFPETSNISIEPHISPNPKDNQINTLHDNKRINNNSSWDKRYGNDNWDFLVDSDTEVDGYSPKPSAIGKNLKWSREEHEAYIELVEAESAFTPGFNSNSRGAESIKGWEAIRKKLAERGWERTVFALQNRRKAIKFKAFAPEDVQDKSQLLDFNTPSITNTQGAVEKGKLSEVDNTGSSKGDFKHWDEIELHCLEDAYQKRFTLTGMTPDFWSQLQKTHASSGFNRTIDALRLKYRRITSRVNKQDGRTDTRMSVEALEKGESSGLRKRCRRESAYFDSGSLYSSDSEIEGTRSKKSRGGSYDMSKSALPQTSNIYGVDAARRSSNLAASAAVVPPVTAPSRKIISGRELSKQNSDQAVINAIDEDIKISRDEIASRELRIKEVEGHMQQISTDIDIIKGEMLLDEAIYQESKAKKENTIKNLNNKFTLRKAEQDDMHYQNSKLEESIARKESTKVFWL